MPSSFSLWIVEYKSFDRLFSCVFDKWEFISEKSRDFLLLTRFLLETFMDESLLMDELLIEDLVFFFYLFLKFFGFLFKFILRKQSEKGYWYSTFWDHSEGYCLIFWSLVFHIFIWRSIVQKYFNLSLFSIRNVIIVVFFIEYK
jgi:hypothetical protein